MQVVSAFIVWCSLCSDVMCVCFPRGSLTHAFLSTKIFCMCAVDSNMTCDASEPPEDGNVGDCYSALPDGWTCQFECDTGFTASGATSCVGGELDAATCDGTQILTLTKTQPILWILRSSRSVNLIRMSYESVLLFR